MTKTHLEAPTTTAERQRAAKSMAARLSNKLIIGGKLVDAITRESFPVENPATAEVIGHAPRCGTQDVEQAVATAQSAFAVWSAIRARQRSAIMIEAAQRLEHESETLAQLSALETGNALSIQTPGEARTMVDILRFYAGLASEMKGKTIPWTQDRFLYTKRVPVGVVGGISVERASDANHLQDRPGTRSGQHDRAEDRRAGPAGRVADI